MPCGSPRGPRPASCQRGEVAPCLLPDRRTDGRTDVAQEAQLRGEIPDVRLLPPHGHLGAHSVATETSHVSQPLSIQTRAQESQSPSPRCPTSAHVDPMNTRGYPPEGPCAPARQPGGEPRTNARSPPGLGSQGREGQPSAGSWSDTSRGGAAARPAGGTRDAPASAVGAAARSLVVPFGGSLPVSPTYVSHGQPGPHGHRDGRFPG